MSVKMFGGAIAIVPAKEDSCQLVYTLFGDNRVIRFTADDMVFYGVVGMSIMASVPARKMAFIPRDAIQRVWRSNNEQLVQLSVDALMVALANNQSFRYLMTTDQLEILDELPNGPYSRKEMDQAKITVVAIKKQQKPEEDARRTSMFG